MPGQIDDPVEWKRVRRVAIVGVGLIGGSLGMDLRARGLAAHVLGIDCSREVLARAASIGAIDEGSVELASVASADAIVFGTPIGVLPGLMQRAASFVGPETIVTDVGSVKRGIVALGERLFGTRFIGGHPMAGSEASGIEAARLDLFERAAWALTPSQTESLDAPRASSLMAKLVAALGARPVYLTPESHDHLVGLVSHLPHALSFAFARALEKDPAGAAAVDIAGASYRDLVRVSRSSFDLWAEIFIANRDLLSSVISGFEVELRMLRIAIDSGDREMVRDQLKHVKRPG